MHKVYMALGGNLSNPRTQFIKALNDLEALGHEILQVSGLWQNPSWPPGQGHPDYLNAVACLQTHASAQELLQLFKRLEVNYGRKLTQRNAPRPLDLDIIDFDGAVLEDKNLILPHPRMHARGFVLLPLADIAATWTHPILGLSVWDLIARLELSDFNSYTFRGLGWYKKHSDRVVHFNKVAQAYV